MEDKICSKAERCPIFSGILKGTQYTETYKSLYCEAGPEGREKCMRFRISQKIGKCPPNVLPNSTKSFDEIISEIKLEGVE